MSKIETIFYVPDAVYKELKEHGDCCDSMQEIFKIALELDICNYDIRTFESNLDKRGI